MAGSNNYQLQEDYDDFDDPDSIADKSSNQLFHEYHHSVSVTPKDLTLKLPNTASHSFKNFQPTFESPESDDYTTKYFAITITEVTCESFFWSSIHNNLVYVNMICSSSV